MAAKSSGRQKNSTLVNIGATGGNNGKDEDSESLDASYQKWIQQQIDKRSLEYSDLLDVSICCATWNVNTKQLADSSELKEWLLHLEVPPADIYAICLQEIVDLNVMNVVLNKSASDEMANHWLKQITEFFDNYGGDEYKVIAEKRMVGVQFIILARSTVSDEINDVRSSVVYTGSYGVMGNKGGIAVSFDLFDSSLCFVGAHFHAGRGDVLARNADYHMIVDSALFQPPPNRKSLATNISAPTLTGSTNAILTSAPTIQDELISQLSQKAMKSSSTVNILYHEYIFWLGDLNYRIVKDVETDTVFDLCNSKQWTSLRACDQLTLQREEGNIFGDFNEGPLNFPPTYKYQPGTSIYEQRPEKKKVRAPAWCDRVLWKSRNHDAVKLQSYTSHELLLSDHKPVSAWFTCGARKIVIGRFRELYRELLFCVDKWINASSPKISVDNRVIDFGQVILNHKHTSQITLNNISTVMAEWKFVTKNEDTIISKPWVKLYPEEGILAPGEQSVVSVTVYITSDMALQMAQSSDEREATGNLDDICVLRLVKGSDFFCVFSAKVDMTCIEEAKAALNSAVADNPLRAQQQPQNKKKSMFLSRRHLAPPPTSKKKDSVSGGNRSSTGNDGDRSSTITSSNVNTVPAKNNSITLTSGNQNHNNPLALSTKSKKILSFPSPLNPSLAAAIKAAKKNIAAMSAAENNGNNDIATTAGHGESARKDIVSTSSRTTDLSTNSEEDDVTAEEGTNTAERMLNTSVDMSDDENSDED